MLPSTPTHNAQLPCAPLPPQGTLRHPPPHQCSPVLPLDPVLLRAPLHPRRPLSPAQSPQGTPGLAWPSPGPPTPGLPSTAPSAPLSVPVMVTPHTSAQEPPLPPSPFRDLSPQLPPLPFLPVPSGTRRSTMASSERPTPAPSTAPHSPLRAPLWRIPAPHGPGGGGLLAPTRAARRAYGQQSPREGQRGAMPSPGIQSRRRRPGLPWDTERRERGGEGRAGPGRSGRNNTARRGRPRRAACREL